MKKAIRTVSKTNYKDHTEPLFKNLQILKLKDIFTFQLSQVMYSFINISLPDPLMTMFTVSRNIHSHDTKHLHQPHIRYRKTAFLSKTLIHQASEIWYKLPSYGSIARSVQSPYQALQPEVGDRFELFKRLYVQCDIFSMANEITMGVSDRGMDVFIRQFECSPVLAICYFYATCLFR